MERKRQTFQDLVVTACQLEQAVKAVRWLRRKQHASVIPWMRTEFLLIPPPNRGLLSPAIYVSVLQVRRLYLHITLILLLHMTGRGTVVLQLEQHILITVIGMLTVTRVHQQVQYSVSTSHQSAPLCVAPPSTSYSPWPAPGTLLPQFSSPHPTPPPPTPHPPPMSGSDGSDSGRYKVCFKIGNISVCNGCRNNFSKSDKIVIQHAEFRHFTSPRTGLPASKFGNAYHTSRRCIELKWRASFNFLSITVPDSVMPNLTSLQKDSFKRVHACSLNCDN